MYGPSHGINACEKDAIPIHNPKPEFEGVSKSEERTQNRQVRSGLPGPGPVQIGRTTTFGSRCLDRRYDVLDLDHLLNQLCSSQSVGDVG